MANIITRASKGAPLSWNEADANFTNLNTDKVETSILANYSTTVETDASIAAALAVHIDDTIDAHVSSAIGYLPAGTGAVATNVQGKLREVVSVKDFGAVGDGVTDDTAAIQNAINAVQAAGGGYELRIPEGKYRVTARLNITSEISIVGEGRAPYKTTLGTIGNGSWLYFDHSDDGIYISGSSVISGIRLEKLGTYRNQPEPSIGWSPNPHGWDVRINNADVYLFDLLLLNPTNGVVLENGGYGRIEMNTVRGQAFDCFVRIEKSADVVKMHNIHVWPFWKDDANVHAYTIQNLDAIYMLRCDNPMLSNVFTIFAKAGIRLEENADGSTSKIHLVNADFDRGKYGIYVGNTFTGTGPSGQFTNVTHQSETGISASRAIEINGQNCELDFVNFSSNLANYNSIYVGGTNNTLTFSGTLRLKNYNQSGGGYPAVEVVTGNFVRINGYPRISSSGSRYGGSGSIFVDEWRDYTPTVSSGTGALTTASAVGRYKLFNDTCVVHMSITITTNGTGGGDVRASLPVKCSSVGPTIPGHGRGSTGKMLQTIITGSATNVIVYNYDNTYPGADGMTLFVVAIYRV